MEERGVTEEEVRQTVLRGEPAEAREPRHGRQVIFTEGYSWLGRYYPHKMVRVIFIEERGRFIVVTAYAYYGRWEGG